MGKTIELSALADALRAQKPVAKIRTLLDEGADPAHIDVIQALEDFQQNGGHNHVWLEQIWRMPEIVQARQMREAADQAAFDLQSALEENDLEAAQDALAWMGEAGDGADVSIDDATFLCVAIQNKCSLDIIELLIDVGGGDPGDGCEDALEALRDLPDDTWKASVMALPVFSQAASLAKKG